MGFWRRDADLTLHTLEMWIRNVIIGAKHVVQTGADQPVRGDSVLLAPQIGGKDRNVLTIFT